MTPGGRAGADGGFPIGATLAAARAARGLDLRAAEELTCMRARYLTALEQDRFDELPGRAYARAFLRTYAAALGLDADRFIAEFERQQPEPPEPAESPAPPRRRRPPLPREAPALGAAAIVAVLAWAVWSSDHPSRPPSVAQNRLPVAHAVPAPRQTVTVGVRAARATRRAPTPLVVRATAGPCWVEVRRAGPTGALLAERTLEPGETLRFAARRIWIRLGAPWNVTLHRGERIVHLAPTTQPVDLVA